jgi:hypothetical protein
MKRPWILVGLLLALPALAQQSSSFKLDEHVLNAGGHPANGTILTSASYEITLDAIGDMISPAVLSGPSYHLDGGFVGAYRPPGEVLELWFESSETLRWSPENSAGDYNLYRDAVGSLSGLGYGTCLENDIPATTWMDFGVPLAGDGYFYLVTVENSLNEEGTKGTDAVGAERANPSPCP